MLGTCRIHKSGGHKHRLVIGHRPLWRPNRTCLCLPLARPPALSTLHYTHSVLHLSLQPRSAAAAQLNITRAPAAWPAHLFLPPTLPTARICEPCRFLGYHLCPIRSPQDRDCWTFQSLQALLSRPHFGFVVDRPPRAAVLYLPQDSAAQTLTLPLRSAPAAFSSYRLPRLGLDTCRPISSRPRGQDCPPCLRR